MSPKRRALRARLLVEQDGKCCYCSDRMRLVIAEPGETLPDDACTIEHPYPKGDPRRGAPNSLKLACHKCNRERGQAHADACQENGHAERAARERVIRRWGSLVPLPHRWMVTI